MRRIDISGVVIGLLLGAGAVAGCAGENATKSPGAAPTASATGSAPEAAPDAATASAPAPTAATPEAPPAAAAASAPEDDESAADLGEHHRHHHHGGVVMFIAMSLDSLGVSSDQQAAIEKIQGDLFAKMEPAHAAEQNLLNVLADGVAAGKIDGAKVDAAIAAVKTTSGGLHKASVESLNALHAALTPEQRTTLVDKVEAHWEVWKTANTTDEKPGDAEHPGHLDLVAKDLDLSPEQVAKIRAAFADKVKNHPLKLDSDQVETYIKEFGTAFEGATFDAKTLKHGPFVHQHLAVWGAKRMTHFYEAITPLLTPEQRAKLSAGLKEHAAAKSGIFDGDKHER